MGDKIMEKISINPSKVRAYGNIITPKTGADFTVSDCTLIVDTDTVNGELVTVYELQPSSTVLSVSLTVDDNSVLIGETVTLSATVEDEMFDPVSGASVSFKLGGSSIGTSTTNSSGIATYTYTCNTAGTLTFSASCMGNNSNNVNVTVTGHDYSLTFSSTSYTTNNNGDATVSAVLTDNGTEVSGATVTFTGGTSTVTATTDSSGVATATVHFTSDGTLTATSNGATDTCNITVLTYLFYDDCSSSSGLSNYGTAILLEGGSAPTFSYDSTENAYKITTPDTKSKCIPINVLTDEDNFKFEADIKPVSRFSMGFSASGGTGNGCIIGFSADSDHLYGWKYTNGSFAGLISDVSGLVDTGYLHITVTVEGTSLNVSITDNNNTTKTATATLPSYSTRYVGIGLGSGTSNNYGYIKNIKVESL